MKQFSFHTFAASVIFGVFFALHLSSADVTHEQCVEATQQSNKIRECCPDQPLALTDAEFKSCMATKMQSGQGMRESLECCGQDSFTRQGLMDGNELVQQALHDRADALGGDWAAKNKEIIDKLLDHIKHIREQHGHQMQGQECDFSAAFMIISYSKEYVRHCPNWVDSDFCATIRKCNDMKPPRQ